MRQDTLINGSLADHVSVDNRGLQYGDGLFETIAVVQGNPCLWDRHMARLQVGASRLGIRLPDTSVLRAEAGRLIETGENCVLKIIVTRAGEGRGYLGKRGLLGLRVLKIFAYPDYPMAFARNGIRACMCQTRIGCSPALAGLKHTGRLEQVLARAEWDDATIAEGLMCDREGRVIEGTQSNLFVEFAGTLVTPDLSCAGVAGVVRGLVMDTAVEQNQEIAEVQLGIDDLFAADAIYLTNSLIGVWRVRELLGCRYPLDRPDHPVIRTARERAFTS